MHLAIRRRARLAGYDEDFVARLGVQSLRAGFITQAVRNGADPTSILRYTGHASVAALHRYTERDQPVDDAVPPLGL
jgi:site-specific recombinase XerD